jgi:phage terminase large subunit-like protein
MSFISGGPSTWATWIAALKAAFGLKLTRAERRAFTTIAGSRKPPKRRVQELWTVAGRGSGKSRMTAAVATYIACFLKHDLDPGETGHVLVLAGSRDQAQMVFSYARAFLNRSPILKKLIKSTTAHEIRLTNGVTIGVHSNSFRLIRGRTLLACVFDEIAFWREPFTAACEARTVASGLPDGVSMT